MIEQYAPVSPVGRWHPGLEPVGAMPLPAPEISIVIPTRNEAGNISELVRKLNAVLADRPAEIIFVDDSTDETPSVINQVARTSARPISLIHREADDRVGGLGGAVTRGIAFATAPWVCVMDADLQHPPELIGEMLRRADRGGSDVVIASRYCPDGDAGEFSRLRFLLSQGSTFLARSVFRGSMRNVTDPMSGFFMVRRSTIDLERLRPRGFKILLEILCRTPSLRIAEVPFRFGARLAGESKATAREGVRYLGHILDLRFGPAWLNFVKFGLVGVSGIFVNMFLLALITQGIGLYYLLSAVLATQGSSLWNFLLTEHWVFADMRRRAGRLRRGALFFAMNNAALGLRGPMLFLLATGIGFHYLLANLISLVALLALRYFTADRFIWTNRQDPPESAPSLAVTN